MGLKVLSTACLEAYILWSLVFATPEQISRKVGAIRRFKSDSQKRTGNTHHSSKHTGETFQSLQQLNSG